MAILRIPVNADQADLKLRTELEGITYVLRIYWNTRAERWFIEILDADENPMLMGTPLNVDTDFLSRFRIEGLMPGILILYDAGEENQEATRDSLGDRHLLLYLESE